jgi:hypothetical protein
MFSCRDEISGGFRQKLPVYASGRIEFMNSHRRQTVGGGSTVWRLWLLGNGNKKSSFLLRKLLANLNEF